MVHYSPFPHCRLQYLINQVQLQGQTLPSVPRLTSQKMDPRATNQIVEAVDLEGGSNALSVQKSSWWVLQFYVTTVAKCCSPIRWLLCFFAANKNKQKICNDNIGWQLICRSFCLVLQAFSSIFTRGKSLSIVQDCKKIVIFIWEDSKCMHCQIWE